MKRIIPFLFLTAFFFSCKKEESKNAEPSYVNKELQTKINSWLDDQKPKTQPNKAANVQLLKDNLDFSKLTIEKSEGDEQIVIVPVKESLKALKKIDAVTIVNLVLILDKNGAIRRGNIALATSLDGSVKEKVPQNTFYSIYNTSHVDWDSKFQFLSVGGRFLYELQYKNSKLHSAGIVQIKGDSLNHVERETVASCTDWYIVTTYYDENDLIIDQTTEYIGRTCSGCDDPLYGGRCPEDYGGGGGGEEANVEFEEPEVVKYVTWNAFSNPEGGSGSFTVYTRLRGKKAQRKFVSVYQDIYFCTYCDTENNGTILYYTIDSYQTGISSSTVAWHWVKGRGRVHSVPFNFEKQQDFYFDQVFP